MFVDLAKTKIPVDISHNDDQGKWGNLSNKSQWLVDERGRWYRYNRSINDNVSIEYKRD